jgi:hypothetical protein
VIEEDLLGDAVAGFVRHPNLEEPSDVVALGVREQRVDAQPGDVGLDALGVLDRRSELAGDQFGIGHAAHGRAYDVEIEPRLAFEGLDPALDRGVLVLRQGNDATQDTPR